MNTGPQCSECFGFSEHLQACSRRRSARFWVRTFTLMAQDYLVEASTEAEAIKTLEESADPDSMRHGDMFEAFSHDMPTHFDFATVPDTFAFPEEKN